MTPKLKPMPKARSQNQDQSELERLKGLMPEFKAHAQALVRWWSRLYDPEMGGFTGEVGTDFTLKPKAPKGMVYHARLLWFFSAMGRFLGSDLARQSADQAQAFMINHGWDKRHGGLYWSVEADGGVRDGYKQAYAQAFGLYGFCQHYELTQNLESLDKALALFQILETRFFDPLRQGYWEAKSEDFGPRDAIRLSEKDMDMPFTMNTHLHILEAYSLLHKIHPSPEVSKALQTNIELMSQRFFRADKGYLALFFDADWTDMSQAISYGHNIEASWLIYEAADHLKDHMRLMRARDIALALADHTLVQGLGAQGEVFYEKILHDEGSAHLRAAHSTASLDQDGEWWGQAEAMVGFLNAYELMPKPDYLRVVDQLWAYIQKEHLSEGFGEWTWYASHSPKASPYLAGEWKCPYHNGRMLIELYQRLSKL